MTTIYLCGFMGCGKSHIGRMLARMTGRKLVDLDAVIVEREGMSIPEIFERFGEPHFRRQNTSVSCPRATSSQRAAVHS